MSIYETCGKNKPEFSEDFAHPLQKHGSAIALGLETVA